VSGKNRTVATVVGAVLLVSGCSSPDLTPVPTVAAQPFACEGVPGDSAELIAGETLEASGPHGTWGDDDLLFGCSLVGEHTLVQVEEMSVTISPWGRAEQDTLRAWESFADARALDLGAPGSGYVFGSREDFTAGWVCNGRSLTVTAAGDPVEGRDRAEDVTNLLASMLPWACEGEDVPPASEEK